MKQKQFINLISVLVIILLVLGIIATVVSCSPSKPDGDPSTNSAPSTEASTEATQAGTPDTQATEPPATQPPVTEPPVTEPPVTEPPVTEPPATEPPVTEPGNNSGEMIGNLYTRDQLMALSNDSRGYGPGPNRPQYNNRPEYAIGDQNAFGKYGANFIAPDNNCIYLTFDCGYEYTATAPDGTKYRVTEDILNTLKEKNVKGVFFITMDYAKKQPDLVQRMIDEGHVVGNHSNTHPSAGMPSCSLDKMVDEIMILHNYVKDTFNYEMTLFRPPTGAYSVRSLAVTQSLGYKTVHWSFAYQDWYTDNQMDPAVALQAVKTKAHSGAIYLLHAVSTTNASILSDAIDYFLAEGYTLEAFK